MLAGSVALLLGLARCPPAPWDDMLSLTPAGATMAIWTDLRKARSSPLWGRFEAETNWKTLAGCDLDSDTLLLALDEAGPLAWVLRGGAANQDAPPPARTLERCGSLKVRRADRHTVVLLPERSASHSPRSRRRSPLARLMCDVPATRTAVFASRLGPESRRRLTTMPSLREAGSLREVVGSVDVGDGLRVWLRARLGSRKDAGKVADGITTELAQLGRHPMLLLAGLSSVVRDVRVRAEGAQTTLEASVDGRTLDRLVQQLEVLSGTSARNHKP